MLSRFSWSLGRFAAAPSRTLVLRNVRPLSASSVLLKPDAPKPAVSTGSIREGLVEKLGVTGPWTLGVGLGVYALSKELYVLNSETVILVVMGGVIWWMMRKIGQPVAEFLDGRSQDILTLLNEGKNKKMAALESGIQQQKEVEAQLEARHDLFEVFLENNKMLLEEEYRRRLHEVNTEVKKRLDYHVEIEQTERQFEQRHMVDWLERQVTEAMKTKQDESLAQCVNDLKKMSVA